MAASRASTPTSTAGGPDQSGRAAEKRWAMVRMALGFLQIFGASLSVVLLWETGVSPVSLTAVVLTCFCTTVSVLLFGSRSPGARR